MSRPLVARSPPTRLSPACSPARSSPARPFAPNSASLFLIPQSTTALRLKSMGRIRILSDQVANQIAAGEVVDRPASVVKELLENALDAGAMRIRVEVEGGGRKLIRIADDGQRHESRRRAARLRAPRHLQAPHRRRTALHRHLGFRGEALPSIASVARVTLETAHRRRRTSARVSRLPAAKSSTSKTRRLPRGTTISVADLFFNTPARRKFLRAESTELAHVTALVTHYALAHPEKHFELLSATHTLVSAPPVARTAERIYQIFGKETLGPTAARRRRNATRARRPARAAAMEDAIPTSRRATRRPPPLRLLLQARTAKAQPQLHLYLRQQAPHPRPAASPRHHRGVPQHHSAHQFPVVLLFLEMPPEEVDVNVHPAKTEVRFRQQSPDSRLRPRQPAHRAHPGAPRGASFWPRSKQSPRQPVPYAAGQSSPLPGGPGNGDGSGLHLSPGRYPVLPDSEPIDPDDAERLVLTAPEPAPAPAPATVCGGSSSPGSFAGSAGLTETAAALPGTPRTGLRRGRLAAPGRAAAAGPPM